VNLHPRLAAIELENLLHLNRLRWHVGERVDERAAIQRQRGIPAPLERDRALPVANVWYVSTSTIRASTTAH
jgi:hypothetical protein